MPENFLPKKLITLTLGTVLTFCVTSYSSLSNSAGFAEEIKVQYTVPQVIPNVPNNALNNIDPLKFETFRNELQNSFLSTTRDLESLIPVNMPSTDPIRRNIDAANRVATDIGNVRSPQSLVNSEQMGFHSMISALRGISTQTVNAPPYNVQTRLDRVETMVNSLSVPGYQVTTTNILKELNSIISDLRGSIVR